MEKLNPLISRISDELLETETQQSCRTDRKVNHFDIDVTEVLAEPDTITLPLGGQVRVELYAQPTLSNLPKTYWETSNPRIIHVTQNGIVSAVGIGEATVSIYFPERPDLGKIIIGATSMSTADYEEETSKVYVTGISLSGSDTVNLESSQIMITFEPTDATETGVTWSSSDTGIATVTDTGVITGVSVGEVTITATSTEETTSDISGSTSINITAIEATSINLDQSSITGVAAGETATLTATILPTTTTDQSITWESGDTSVATVSNSGVITMVALGETTITATSSNGLVATCSLEVDTVRVTGISLNLTTISGEVGDIYYLTTTFSPSDATNRTVSWTNSNTSAVLYESGGKVTLMEVGTAVLTVTTGDGGYSASCEVTVAEAEPEIELTSVTPDYTTTYVGESMNVAVAASTEESFEYTLTSSDSNVLQVNADNTVTALSSSDTPVTLTATTTEGSSVTSEEISVVVLDYELSGTYIDTDILYFSYTQGTTFMFGVQPNIVTERPDLKITDPSALEDDGSLSWTMSDNVYKGSAYSSSYNFSFSVSDDDFSDATVSFELTLDGKTYTDTKTWECAPRLVSDFSVSDAEVAVGEEETITITYSSVPYNRELTCVSGDTSIALVSETTTGTTLTSSIEATITGVATGSTTITFTSTDGTEISKTINVTVVEASEE